MTKQEKALIEERNRIATQMRGIVDSAETEERGLGSEERQNWENLNTEIENIDSRIDVMRRQSDVDAGLEDAIHGEDRSGEPEMSIGEQRNEAFRAFVRSHPDFSPLSAEHRQAMAEMRAQATGTDTAGGFTVPEEWASAIESAMLAYGGIRGAATVMRTASGEPMHMPTDNDTANSGSILAENTQDAEQDVAFSELVLNAYKYTSNIIRVPVELLQDSAFNMEAFLQRKFAERLGRATSAHYATGTGTNQPKGLFTAATSGVTAASGSAITYNELIDLKHSVDPAYRQSPSWVFNDSTLKALKQLQDSQGRPLWSPGIGFDIPATLDGNPYIIDQGAPDIGLSSTPIGYGDLSKYVIRDAAGISMVRMVERYADFHQVGFVAFMRTDADLLDAGTNPVKKLTMAAT